MKNSFNNVISSNFPKHQSSNDSYFRAFEKIFGLRSLSLRMGLKSRWLDVRFGLYKCNHFIVEPIFNKAEF